MLVGTVNARRAQQREATDLKLICRGGTTKSVKLLTRVSYSMKRTRKVVSLTYVNQASLAFPLHTRPSAGEE